jgi:hypothetical protein
MARRPRLAALLVVAAAACGSDDDPSTTAAASTTQPSTTQSEPASSSTTTVVRATTTPSTAPAGAPPLGTRTYDACAFGLPAEFEAILPQAASVAERPSSCRWTASDDPGRWVTVTVIESSESQTANRARYSELVAAGDAENVPGIGESAVYEEDFSDSPGEGISHLEVFVTGLEFELLSTVADRSQLESLGRWVIAFL